MDERAEKEIAKQKLYRRPFLKWYLGADILIFALQTSAPIEAIEV